MHPRLPTYDTGNSSPFCLILSPPHPVRILVPVFVGCCFGFQWSRNTLYYLGGLTLYTLHVMSRLESWKR